MIFFFGLSEKMTSLCYYERVTKHSLFHSRLRSCYKTLRIAPVLDNRAVLLSFDTVIMLQVLGNFIVPFVNDCFNGIP